MTKAGTPTMGGVAIVVAAATGWLVSDLFDGTFTRRGILVIGAMIGAGLVGLLDDWIKVTKERNLGLNKRAKIVGPARRGDRLRGRRADVHQRGDHRLVHPLRLPGHRARQRSGGSAGPSS